MSTPIATRFSHAREQSGLSIGQVARRTGRYRSEIAGIESGHKPVSEQELATFADLFGVSTRWLAGKDIDEPVQGETPLRLAARAEGTVNARELDELVRFLRSVRS
jgi:transcriptional regulator with XRE-family HTH domain